jgi:hypothetical protein
MTLTTFYPMLHYSENSEAARVRDRQLKPSTAKWREIDRLIELEAWVQASLRRGPTPRSYEQWRCESCGDYSRRSGSFHPALGWVCDRQKCMKLRWDKCVCVQCQFPEDYRIRWHATYDKLFEEKRPRDE